MPGDAIFALATAAGRAGVAVFRVSGPEVLHRCSELFDKEVEFRKPAVRVLRDPRSGETIDEALVVAFAKGASFTGEEVVEFHCHGSPAVIRAMSEALNCLPGLRQAKEGEFTRRALENGRLDLVQVEGLGDLISAETEAQRLQAIKVMRGELSRKIEKWRGMLVEVGALLEALIDFSDEDLPDGVLARARSLIEELAGEFGREIAGNEAAERIRDGFEVALVGAPNTGKSTLLNRIAGREVAITSEIAGTTRDVIEVHLELNGLAVTLLDTAGVHESDDQLEALGIARARARAESADLRVFLVDSVGEGESNADYRDGDIVVISKGDLRRPSDGLHVSGLTGLGVGALLDLMKNKLADRVVNATSLIRRRHRYALEKGLEYLGHCEMHLTDEIVEIDLAAEDIRISMQALDEMVGRVNVEGLLDVIFSNFCIGK